MKQRNLWRWTATLLIACSIVLSGCGNKEETYDAAPTLQPAIVPDGNADSTATPKQGETAQPKSKQPEVPSVLEENATATSEPTASPNTTASPTATAKPKASTKPSASSKPSVSAKPTAVPKPTASAKPTASSKPSASAKPSASSKPSASAKPSATPKPSAAPTSIDTAAISKAILEAIELPALLDVSGDMVADVYYLEADQYAEGSFLRAMMNIKATDLAVVKLNDEKDFELVKEALTKRAEDVIEIFSTYLPDQYEDAKNYQIVREGSYVLYSISHDQEGVLEAFKSALE